VRGNGGFRNVDQTEGEAVMADLIERATQALDSLTCG
jgi:hypothetical protein